MENLPTYVSIVFVLTTLLTVWFFYKAAHHSNTTLIILLAWLALQSLVGISGFFTVTDVLPPRFLLLVLPPLFFIIGMFANARGRNYIDQLDIRMLTLLHVVRIPVEIVLYWLFINKSIPEIMTFEGRNFDILSGLTAPFVYYFGFIKKTLGKNVILFWNFLCLGLLLNIVIHAILSAPFPFQKFGFDQPNVGVLYYPFIWLPGCIVPLVLLSHLGAIRKLLRYEGANFK